MSKQFLIICRVGDASLHTQWIKNSNRNFDIYLSYYGDSAAKYREDADFYEQVKGPKWPILHDIIRANAELINQYDAVWLPDDDLLISTESICRMFNIFAALQFNLAQPALALESHVSHAAVIQDTNYLARKVNFVEVMAPIFSRQALQQLHNTFKESHSGWGLDLVWPTLLNYSGIALIDATPVVHTRPVGKFYKDNAMNPQNDIKELMQLYPHLDLSIGQIRKNFRVYSTLRFINTRKLFAGLRGRLLVKSNRRKYRKSKRFQPPV